ncbi:MAG TPA: hypothetical protein VH593_11335 [Ktedonobacteraceae bacterium]|jgi:hypothetical protein
MEKTLEELAKDLQTAAHLVEIGELEDAGKILGATSLELKPVGICPACGKAVYNLIEGSDGPVWTCAHDLSPNNRYYEDGAVSEEIKERDGDWSCCPWNHVGDGRHMICPGEMPLHGACYDKGNY